MLCQITGTNEKYSSAVPEPFTYIPADLGTVQTANGNTDSAFLEIFGRSPRDTGRLCERNLAPSAAQRLEMLNSSHIQHKIDQSEALRSLVRSQADPRQAVTAVYLTVLSRPPTTEELRTIAAYPDASGLSRRDALIDLVWALVNSDEFLYRH